MLDFSAQGIPNPLSRFDDRYRTPVRQYNRPPVQGGVEDVPPQSEPGFWGRNFGAIGGWFSTPIGTGAFAGSQERNRQIVEGMTSEQREAAFMGIMYSVIGANAPSAIPATVRPMLQAQSRARSLGVTPTQYSATMFHDVALSESAMKRNIIYSSLAAAPFAMAAAPITAGAIGGGILGTTGGLLASGAIGAASSLPFTIAETGSPYGPGGSRLTIGETSLLGLDIGSDLLLAGAGRAVFGPAARGVGTAFRRSVDPLVAPGLRRRAQDILGREFGISPRTVEETAASSRVQQQGIIDRYRETAFRRAELSPLDAQFRGSDEFAFPGVQGSMTYARLARTRLQQQGFYVPGLEREQPAVFRRMAEDIATQMYVTKGGAVTRAQHEEFVMPRAMRLIREQLPTEDVLSTAESYSQASRAWTEEGKQILGSINNLRTTLARTPMNDPNRNFLADALSELESTYRKRQPMRGVGIRDIRSQLYQHSTAYRVQAAGAQVVRDPNVISDRMRAATAKIADEVSRENFISGMANPRTGVSSIVTSDAAFTAEGNFMDMSRTLTGKPQAAALSQVQDNNFRAIVNFSGKDRNVNQFLSWLKRSNLVIEDGYGLGPGDDLAVVVTSDKSREGFFSFWKSVGIDIDVNDRSSNTSKLLLDLLGKRGGLARVADLQGRTRTLPKLDSSRHMDIVMDDLSLRVGLVKPKKYVSIANAKGEEKVIDYYHPTMSAFNKLPDDASRTKWMKDNLEAGYSFRRLDSSGNIMTGSYTDASAIMSMSTFRSKLFNAYQNQKASGGVQADVAAQRSITKYIDDTLKDDEQFTFALTHTMHGGFHKADVQVVSDAHFAAMEQYLIDRNILISGSGSKPLDIIGSTASLKTGYRPTVGAVRILFKPDAPRNDSSNYRIINSMQQMKWLESIMGRDLVKRIIKPAYRGMRRAEWQRVRSMFANDQPSEAEMQTIAQLRTQREMSRRLDEGQSFNYDEEFAMSYYDEISERYSQENPFMSAAMKRGAYATSRFRLYSSTVGKAVARGGTGMAPSGALQAVYGRLLPAEFFTKGTYESQDHVKLIFDDSGRYIGLAPHEKDVATWEFIRGTEGSDADDHALTFLLKSMNNRKQWEYFLPIGRDPQGVGAGLVRRISKVDADKFTKTTRIEAIDVTNTEIQTGNQLVRWNFGDVRSGQARNVGFNPTDLPMSGSPLRLTEHGPTNIRRITQFNREKGNIGKIDVYMRLLTHSGVDSDIAGGVFSDVLDALTRFRGSSVVAEKAIKNEIRQWLEANPRRSLDKHLIEEYPWLKRDFEEYLSEVSSPIAAGVRYEYTSLDIANVRKDALLESRVFENVQSILFQGSRSAMTKQLDTRLLQIARRATTMSSGLHNRYRSPLYAGVVEGDKLTTAQSDVVNQGLREAVNQGYMPQDYAAALMQVAVSESSAGRRKGFNTAISDEILELLDRSAYESYFESFDDFQPALRLEFGGGIAAGVKQAKEYVVRRQQSASGAAYHIGEMIKGEFKALQEIQDVQMGAIAEAAGPLRYQGSIGATVGQTSLYESGLFGVGRLGIDEWSQAEEITRRIIGGRTLSEIIQDPTLSGFDWEGLARGLEAPEGILDVQKTTVSPSGMLQSVRGSLDRDLTPEQLRLHAMKRRRILIFDVENDYKKLVRGRERANVGYWGAQIINDDGSVEHIALSLNDVKAGVLNDIVGSVTDVVGYNVSHDLDLTARNFGVNFEGKVVWDLRKGGEAAGLGGRGMVRAATKEEDTWVSGKLEGGVLSPQAIEDRVRRFWGNALRQLPLKGPGSITEMLGLSRGELEVPAGELMERMYRDPNNKDLQFVMDLYNRLDVEQTGALWNILSGMLPEQFGRFGAQDVVGRSWDDLGMQPVASYYDFLPDVNDARLRDPTMGMEFADEIDPMMAETGQEYIELIKQANRAGNRATRMPLLQAWGRRTASSGAPGVLSAAMRGMQWGGTQLTALSGRTFGAAGRGIGRGMGMIPAGRVGRGIGRGARFVAGSSSGNRLRGEIRSDTSGELVRGGITEQFIQNTDVGQFARIMQLPGVYSRSGMDVMGTAISAGISGLPFMTGWWMAGRNIGRLYDSPASLARFSGAKQGEILQLSMHRTLREGGGYAELAERIITNQTGVGPARLRALRDRGDFNVFLRALKGDNPELYERLYRRLDEVGDNDELYRRTNDEGTVQYGNYFSMLMKDLWNQKVRGREIGLKKITANLEDPKRLEQYETHLSRLSRDANQLINEANRRGLSAESQRRIADQILPFMKITRDMPNYEELMTRNRARGGDGRIDIDIDFDLLTDEQKRQVRRDIERREAFMADIPTAKSFGRMDWGDNLGRKIYAMTLGIETGSPVRRTGGRVGWGINTPWTRELDVSSGRNRMELRGDMLKGRMGGSIIDPEEWRRSTDWRSWLPTRGLARPLLLAQAGILGAAGAEGAIWEERRRREFGSEFGSGYNTLDLFNAEAARRQEQMEMFQLPLLSRSFPGIQAIPLIGRLPIPYIGEYAVGPRRAYARDYNKREMERISGTRGATFEPMNEEFMHVNRPWITAPPSIHPWLVAKLAAAPPSRWASDLPSTIQMPWDRQGTPFSATFQDDWGSLEPEQQRLYSGVNAVLTDEQWEQVRSGAFEVIEDRNLRRNLAQLKQLSDSGQWNTIIKDMQAYSGYVRQGSSRENAGFAARSLSPGLRRVVSRQAAQGIRGRSIEEDPRRATSWQALQMGLRSQYGKDYDWQGSPEWARDWGEENIQPFAALSREDYEYENYRPGWHEYSKFESADTSMMAVLHAYLRHLEFWKKPVRYVRPSEGQDWIKIPEVPKYDLSEPSSRVTDTLRNAANEYDSLKLTNPLSVPQMQEGGVIPANSGGTLINAGEAGYDEAIIPLDKSVLADIFSNLASEGGVSSAEELADIASAMHDVARILGGLEASIGDSIYQISASNKGMGEALRLASAMDAELQASGTFGEGSKMAFVGTGATEFAEFGGNALNMNFWQQQLAESKAAVDRSLDWTPFDTPQQMPDWATGFDTSSGVFTMARDMLAQIKPQDVSEVPYSRIYGQDAIDVSLEKIRSQAIFRLPGDDTEYYHTRPKINEAVFGEQYTYDSPIPGADIVKGDPMPAQMVPPGAFESGVIRPRMEDVWMVDADTVRQLTTPFDTRGIDPITGAADPTVLGRSVDAYGQPVAMRALEHTIDPTTGDADVTAFNDALRLMTERFRVEGVDAPEHYEVGGPIANAIAAGFMEQFASQDRLFFDIKGQAAFGEDSRDPEARSVVDIFGATESGEAIRIQDYLQATGWTRAEPESFAQAATAATAEARGEGLFNEFFTSRGWGADVDVRQLSIAEQTLMREARYAGVPASVLAGLTPSMRGIDFEQYARIPVGTGDFDLPRQMSTMDSMIGKMPELVSLDSIVAALDVAGIQGGLPDPAQFADMLGPNQRLVGDAALLSAVYGDAPEHEPIREAAMRLGSRAREQTLAAAERYELQGTRAGIDIGEGLLSTMPSELSEKLYGTTQPVQMFGTQYDRLAEDIAKLRERGYREAITMMGKDEQALREGLGVSTVGDKASYYAASVEAGEKLAAFEAERLTTAQYDDELFGGTGVYDRREMFKGFVTEGYVSRNIDRLEYEAKEADRRAAVGMAGARVRQTASYFDPFAKDVTSDMVETSFGKLEDQTVLRSILGAVGRMSGVGGAEDMFGMSMQYAVAGQNLRKDPSTWAMAGLTGGQDLFTGGFEQSMVDLAVERFEVGRGTRLSDAPDGAATMLQDMSDRYGAVISPFEDSLEAGIASGAIKSELDLVTELFRDMFASVISAGENAAREFSGLEFDPEFSNANLRRNAAGEVEFRRTLENLPSGFVEALKQMGTGSSILVPGQRSAEQTDRAYEVDPLSGAKSPGSGVWQVGGATYGFDESGGSEGRITVTEDITRKVEQKRKGDKWYTYIDGVWDQKDPQADKRDVPDEIKHGTMETVYDVATGQMVEQYETFGDTGRVKLFEGAPIAFPDVQEEAKLDLEAFLKGLLPDDMSAIDFEKVFEAAFTALMAGVDVEELSAKLMDILPDKLSNAGLVSVLEAAFLAAAEGVDSGSITENLLNILPDKLDGEALEKILISAYEVAIVDGDPVDIASSILVLLPDDTTAAQIESILLSAYEIAIVGGDPVNITESIKALLPTDISTEKLVALLEAAYELALMGGDPVDIGQSIKDLLPTEKIDSSTLVDILEDVLRAAAAGLSLDSIIKAYRDVISKMDPSDMGIGFAQLFASIQAVGVDGAEKLWEDLSNSITDDMDSATISKKAADAIYLSIVAEMAGLDLTPEDIFGPGGIPGFSSSSGGASQGSSGGGQGSSGGGLDSSMWNSIMFGGDLGGNPRVSGGAFGIDFGQLITDINSVQEAAEGVAGAFMGSEESVVSGLNQIYSDIDTLNSKIEETQLNIGGEENSIASAFGIEVQSKVDSLFDTLNEDMHNSIVNLISSIGSGDNSIASAFEIDVQSKVTNLFNSLNEDVYNSIVGLISSIGGGDNSIASAFGIEVQSKVDSLFNVLNEDVYNSIVGLTRSIGGADNSLASAFEIDVQSKVNNLFNVLNEDVYNSIVGLTRSIGGGDNSIASAFGIEVQSKVDTLFDTLNEDVYNAIIGLKNRVNGSDSLLSASHDVQNVFDDIADVYDRLKDKTINISVHTTYSSSGSRGGGGGGPGGGGPGGGGPGGGGPGGGGPGGGGPGGGGPGGGGPGGGGPGGGGPGGGGPGGGGPGGGGPGGGGPGGGTTPGAQPGDPNIGTTDAQGIDTGQDTWQGGFALPTSGGVALNVAEMGEGEAILPLSKVPGIFAEAFARSADSMKSMTGTASEIMLQPIKDMLASVPSMIIGMSGATDSYMDSVNASGDGVLLLENHVSLEMGGEEVVNVILEAQELALRSGRGAL